MTGTNTNFTLLKVNRKNFKVIFARQKKKNCLHCHFTVVGWYLHFPHRVSKTISLYLLTSYEFKVTIFLMKADLTVNSPINFAFS